MSESEPIVVSLPGRGAARPLGPGTGTGRQQAKQIAFDRRELTQILGVYGRKVAAGEWRDYAIDMLREKAVFSVFRKASEHPLYRIEKSPKLARRQGAYAVISPTGLILRRGHDLGKVLRVLEKRVRLVEA
ncbi:MAG: hypothetical protein Kow0032_09590 [Methyloligellaceae bacterium]